MDCLPNRQYCSRVDCTFGSHRFSPAYDGLDSLRLEIEAETDFMEDKDEDFVVVSSSRKIIPLWCLMMEVERIMRAVDGAEFSALRNENANLRQEVNNLKYRLSQERINAKVLQKEIINIKYDMQEMEQQHEEVKLELENNLWLEKDNADKLQEEISTLQQEIERSQEEKSQMFEQFVKEKHELEESTGQWKHKIDQHYRNEIFSLYETLKEYKLERNLLDDLSQKQKSKITELEMVLSKPNVPRCMTILDPVSKFRKYNSMSTMLAHDLSEKRIVDSINGTTETKQDYPNTSLEIQCSKLMAENRRLNEQLSKEKDTAKTIGDAANKLKKEMNDQSKLLRKNSKKLEDIEKINQQLKKEIQQLEQEKKILDEKVATQVKLEEQFSKIKSENEKSVRENNRINEQLSRETGAAKQRDGLLKSERNESETLREKIKSLDKLEETMRELRNKIQQLRQEKKKLEEDNVVNNSKECRSKQYKESYVSIHRVMEDMREEKRKAEEDLARHLELQKKNEKENSKKLTEMQNQIDKQNAEINRLKQTNDELKKVSDAAARKQKGVLDESKYSDIQCQLQDAREEVRKKQRELEEEMSSRLSETDASTEKKGKEVKILTEELTRLRKIEENNRQLRNEIQQLGREKKKFEVDFIKRMELVNKSNEFQIKQNEESKAIIHKVAESLKEEKRKAEEDLARHKQLHKRNEEENLRKILQLKNQIDSQTAEIKFLKKTNEDLKGKQKDGSDETNYREIQEQLQHAKEQLRKAQKELDEAKSRLSRAMGDRLTDNNPNIADLSDKNRPTKISERFQELYDNQWTDAFEVVNFAYNDEDKTISVLKSVLMNALEFCKKEAVKQMKQLTDVLSKGIEIPSSMMKTLKDSRKTLAELYGKGLFEEYSEFLKKSHSEEANLAMEIKSFVKECFEICWLMVVQDPPVALGPEVRSGEPFDKDHYKAYTKSGDRVEMTVWPVLLLHQNGPVLCKGVAQGK